MNGGDQTQRSSARTTIAGGGGGVGVDAVAAVAPAVGAAAAATGSAIAAQEIAAAAAKLRNTQKPTQVRETSATANTSTQPTSAAAETTTSPSSMSSSSSTALANPFAVHYFASFHQICVVTALLPLVTLFTCFVTAYVFQYDEVHETHCRVYNIVPSISAITGVSPQRYFWRFSIAVHLGPRIPIAFVYKNYYHSFLEQLRQRAPHQVPKTSFLITLILILNCIEISALGGVTYISNRENYPIHERIFITFMICSLCHMLATIKLNGILHDNPAQLTNNQRESIKWKKILFVTSILSTIGLLIFFAKHRFYCHDLAFSWFAFFEYLIAISNMLFHFTIIWDFPSQHMLIVQGPRTKLEQIFNAPKKLN